MVTDLELLQKLTPLEAALASRRVLRAPWGALPLTGLTLQEEDLGTDDDDDEGIDEGREDDDDDDEEILEEEVPEGLYGDMDEEDSYQ